MMMLTPGSNVGRNVCRRAGLHVAVTVITVITQQRLRFAQRLGRLFDGFQRRFDFLFVIGVLRDVFGHDQHALRIHAHLHVVGLLEMFSTRRHDAGFVIGEIDLIIVADASLRRLGFRSSRRFALGFGGFPFGTLGLIFSLL